MNFHSVITLCAGSVTFCVGIYHFMYSARLRTRGVDQAFAVICFMVGLYDLASAMLYSSMNMERGMFWQRWQYMLLCGMGVAVLWFVSEFTGRKNRKLDYLFAGYWLAQAMVIILDRSNLTLLKFAQPRSFSFLGTFNINYYEAAPGILLIIQSLVGVLAGVYVAYSLVSYARCEDPAKCTPVLIGMSCLILAVTNDMLVSWGVYDSIYLIELGFLFVILCMGYSLNEVHLRVQNKLEESSDGLKRLEAAVNAAAESIVITNVNGEIQYVNPAFEKMTGYKSNEVAGMDSSVVQSGKHSKELYQDLWKTISSGGVWRGQFTNRKKDGSLFEEEAVISPVKDSAGKIVNYVAVKRDVTQERRLEGQLRQSQKMEALGRLASGIAHDFTNMLAIILGHAQIVKTRVADQEDLSESVVSIIESTSQLSSLTGDLLAFAHQKPLTMKSVDVNRVVKGMEDMLDRSIESSIKLKVETCKEKLVGELDPDHIEQAIMYLCVNAVDAMPEGGNLIIETWPLSLSHNEIAQVMTPGMEQERDTQRFAVISVTDTGCGMPEEVVSRVFEPFFTTKGKGRTTGLGLSTAYGIIAQHDGNITVYSTPGHGTTFKIYLPLDPVAEARSTDPNEMTLVSTGGTVLVSEDDYIGRRVAVRILQELGFSVLEAEDSVQAMELFNANRDKIGLLITDIMMPEIGGVELAKRLKKDKPDLKIIFASGYPESHLRATGIVTNGDPVVNKPFSLQSVKDAISDVMAG
ncbi:hypothetical protein BVX97_03165 [bacterium E08(2017)]|nr:hypothetical protein BVX97_03165 [bacterium E08(2017)]